MNEPTWGICIVSEQDKKRNESNQETMTMSNDFIFASVIIQLLIRLQGIK